MDSSMLSLPVFLAASFLLLGVRADVCEVEPCPAQGIALLLIPSDCSSFVSCLNGKATILRCPEQFSFDVKLQRCIPKSESKCTPCKQDININSNGNFGVQVIEPRAANVVSNDFSKSNNISERCIRNSITTVVCPPDIADDRLLPHPDDCGLFYVCISIELPPVCRDCPSKLHFNPTKKVCDHPESAGCLALDFPRDSKSYVPDAKINRRKIWETVNKDDLDNEIDTNNDLDDSDEYEDDYSLDSDESDDYQLYNENFREMSPIILKQQNSKDTDGYEMENVDSEEDSEEDKSRFINEVIHILKY